MTSSLSVTGRSKVTVLWESGRIVVQPARRSPSGVRGVSARAEYRQATVEETGFSRARTTMTDYAVANHLDAFIDLTYANEPDDPDDAQHEMDKFLKRFRRRCPGEPWIAVLHRGGRNGRLHHHMLMSATIPRHVINDTWGNGYIRRGLRPTVDDIRASAHYMARGSQRPATERPSVRRYRISAHGIRPSNTTFNISTADVDTFTEQLTGGRNIHRWYATNDQPWFDWVGYFTPDTYQNL